MLFHAELVAALLTRMKLVSKKEGMGGRAVTVCQDEIPLLGIVARSHDSLPRKQISQKILKAAK